MMAESVYILCALTSVLCATLLWRRYRATRTRLLFWSSLCFVGLALNNAFLFADLVLVPTIDLSALRHATALGALCVLIYGLVSDAT
jgi:hypothetical protein